MLIMFSHVLQREDEFLAQPLLERITISQLQELDKGLMAVASKMPNVSTNFPLLFYSVDTSQQQSFLDVLPWYAKLCSATHCLLRFVSRVLIPVVWRRQ